MDSLDSSQHRIVKMPSAKGIAKKQIGPQALSIKRLIESRAEADPSAIAILAPGCRPLTYGRLHSEIERLVVRLNSAGIGKNDRVALVLPNGPHLTLAFLAVAAGATAAPLNPRYRASEFEFYLSDLNAKALMVEATSDSPAIEVAQRLGIPVIKVAPTTSDNAGIFTIPGPNYGRRSVANFAQPDDIAIVLHTSGTTARPKIVPLTNANICASAQNISRAFDLEAADRCLNIMPLFHVHGLIGGVLASLTAGASVVCTDGLDLAEFFNWMHQLAPTWYSASPAMHQAILSCADSNRKQISASSLRFIRSCSAPLPPQVMSELEQVFGVPVIESYGMTEAAHQITSNPLPPRHRKAGSVGLPTGPEVAILDDAGKPVTQGELGEIAIRGVNVMLGYENNREANEKSFVRSWFRTGDQGYLDADGYLYISGRIKEIINRGGEKISPREIDEILLRHPAVAQAVAFAVPHKVLGEDVAAAVTLRANARVTENEIRTSAALHLADFKVPRRILIVEEIPKGPTGKVQRIGLAEKLGMTGTEQLSQPERSNRDPSATWLEAALAAIWAQVLHLDKVGIHENFFELGGHSLVASQIISQIGAKFGKTLSLASFVRAPTIHQMAEIFQNGEAQVSPSPLVPVQPKGSKPPLFWIYWDSGNEFLPTELGADQPLYGFEHVNADGIAPTQERVEDIADHYLKAMRAVQPRGPYFIGGYCFGGLVAFEMAQQLLGAGESVAMLALLAPVSIDQYKSLPLDIPFSLRLKRCLSVFRSEIHLHFSVIEKLRRRDVYPYVRVRLCGRAYEALMMLQGWVKNTMMKVVCELCLAMRRPLPISLRLFHLLEIYRKARKAYFPEIYRGRITIFKAQNDLRDITGWKKVAVEGVEVHEVPGDHDSVLHETYGSAWAKLLRDKLNS